MVEIRPQPGPQELFLSTPADIAIYGGAAGGGKTFALLMESMRHITNPKFGGVIFRRTMKQVTQEGGIWDESTMLFPGLKGSPNLTERYWTFPSGATISFAGLEHEHDKLNFQGAQLAYIGFDELTHFTEGQFFYLLSRNRSLCGVKPYIRGTCNPGPGWVKKLLAPWVDKSFPNPAKSGELRWFRRDMDQLIWMDEKPVRTPCKCLETTCQNCFPPEKSLTFIRASVFDNKILLEKNPGYVTNLMAQNEYEKASLLRGEWDAELPNRVLDQFIEARHKVPRRQFPDTWMLRHVAADFGGANTAELAIVEDPDGPLIVYGEDWPGHSRDWGQIANDIRRIVGRSPVKAFGGNATGEQGWRQAFRREGIPFVEPDVRLKDVALQYQNVNALFASDQLFITEDCPKLISMIQSFQRPVDDNGSPLDKIEDTRFHLCAALRYGCTGLRPPKRGGSMIQPARKGWM